MSTVTRLHESAFRDALQSQLIELLQDIQGALVTEEREPALREFDAGRNAANRSVIRRVRKILASNVWTIDAEDWQRRVSGQFACGDALRTIAVKAEEVAIAVQAIHAAAKECEENLRRAADGKE